MKKLSKKTIAALVVLFGLLITPFMVWAAFLERGYKAIGGEYLPLVLAVVIAVTILTDFKDTEPAPPTMAKKHGGKRTTIIK